MCAGPGSGTPHLIGKHPHSQNHRQPSLAMLAARTPPAVGIELSGYPLSVEIDR